MVYITYIYIVSSSATAAERGEQTAALQQSVYFVCHHKNYEADAKIENAILLL